MLLLGLSQPGIYAYAGFRLTGQGLEILLVTSGNRKTETGQTARVCVTIVEPGQTVSHVRVKGTSCLREHGLAGSMASLDLRSFWFLPWECSIEIKKIKSAPVRQFIGSYHARCNPENLVHISFHTTWSAHKLENWRP